MAEKADIHELYEKSVQAVDVEVEFLRDTYRALRGRDPSLGDGVIAWLDCRRRLVRA
jgi:hypothetical protein